MRKISRRIRRERDSSDSIAYNNIIANIKDIIKNKGLKQSFVAGQAGLTSQSFSDILNNRKLLRVEHLPELADALGVEIEDFLERKSEKNGRKTKVRPCKIWNRTFGNV